MAEGPHISLSAETLFSVGSFDVTNSIFTSVLLSTILILFALYANMSIKQTSKPSGFQNLVEMIVEGLYNLVHSVTNNKAKTEFFLPFIASFFFFILINNWSGLVPGVGTIGIVHGAKEEKHASASQSSLLPQAFAADSSDEDHEAAPDAASSDSDHSGEDTYAVGATDHAEDDGHHGPVFVPFFRPGSADLNTTIALGIVSVFLTQIVGLKYLNLGYFKKFINFSSPINFIVGILETVSEFAKILSFAFRLFGNIFAGEVLLVVIAFIGGKFLFFAPIPFYGLEIFVGFIQALVFSMLTLVFFNMATISHDDH